jgi:hypothetical protein
MTKALIMGGGLDALRTRTSTRPSGPTASASPARQVKRQRPGAPPPGRRQRTEEVVAHSYTLSDTKTKGPAGRVVRGLHLPLALTLVASKPAHARLYRYHIGWWPASSRNLANSSASRGNW